MNVNGYRIDTAKDGNPTLIVSAGGRELPLHSKVSPLSEGERYFFECDPEKYDLLIVLGCGIGYHLMGIKNFIDNFSLVVIVDILGGVERVIASVSHTSFITKSEKVRIISGDKPEQVRLKLEEIIDVDKFNGIKVIDHPPSLRIFNDYYEQIGSSVREIIDRVGSNRATVNAFGMLFLRNSINNILNFDNVSPVVALKNRFRNIPAVILASAPSLEDNIAKIAQFRNRFAIIAVDSALSALREYSIVPDFAVSIDPQHRIGEHFIGHQGGSCSHILSIVSNPNLVRRTGGFLSLNSHPISQIIENFFPGEIGAIDSGTGSVAGDALSFAMLCGFNPVCMVGFDFSFSKNIIYARGTAYQNRYSQLFNNRFMTPEGFNASYIFRSSRAFFYENRYTRRSFVRYRDSLNDFLGKNGRKIFFLNSQGLTVDRGTAITFEEFITSLEDEIIVDDFKSKVDQAMSKRIGEIVDKKIFSNVINHKNYIDELLQASLGRECSDYDLKKISRYFLAAKLL